MSTVAGTFSQAHFRESITIHLSHGRHFVYTWEGVVYFRVELIFRCGWIEMESESEEGEDKFNYLQTLFDEEKETGSSSDESASDKEWKEAVRAAVETEIQYQVQLRLAAVLGGPVGGDQDNELDPSAVASATHMKLEREKRKLLQKERIVSINNTEDISQPDSSKEEPQKIQKDHQLTAPILPLLPPLTTAPKPTITTNTTSGATKQHTFERGTIYEYLSSKYGTPHEQLQNLVKTGRFRCLPDEARERIGVDKRIRWPIECNISQGTPRHKASHKHSKIPMQFFEPLLGQHRRPSFMQSSSANGSAHSIIFDCRNKEGVGEREGEHKGAEREGEGERGEREEGLKFESRFESGNLRQVIQM